MNNFCKNIVSSSIFLLLAMYLFSCEMYAKSIEVSHISWSPFEDHHNKEKPGISIEMVDKILSRMGYTEINYQKVPWSRAIAQLEWGKTHLIPSIWYQTDRTQFAYYSNPYTVSQIKLFSLTKNNIVIDNQADLKNLFIAAYRSSALVPDMKRWAKKVTETEDTTVGIRLLKGNRVNAVIEDQISFEYQAQNVLDMSTVTISNYTYKAEGLYAGFSRKLPNVKQVTMAFNAELKKMIDSGEIKSIFSQYGITWIPPTKEHIEISDRQPHVRN